MDTVADNIAKLTENIPDLAPGMDRIYSLFIVDRPCAETSTPIDNVQAGIDTRDFLQGQSTRFGVEAPTDVHIRTLFVDVTAETSDVFGADNLTDLPEAPPAP